MGEKITYAEHRRRQREYEREQWRNASPEEREQRIKMRCEYLFAVAARHPERLHDVVECPDCTPGTTLSGHEWPRFYICHNCDSAVVIDMHSHLVQDDREHFYIEPLRGLSERYTRYEWI